MEEKVEELEDKGGREVTQARVQLHQMQPTGNHSTPFKLVLGALQSIAQIVLYLETKSGGLLFQPVQTIQVDQKFFGRQKIVPFVVAQSMKQISVRPHAHTVHVVKITKGYIL